MGKLLVHMHDRLSASTVSRPLRQEVASDSRGAGNVLTGMSFVSGFSCDDCCG